MTNINNGIDLSPLRKLPLWVTPLLMQIEGKDAGVCLTFKATSANGNVMHVNCFIRNGEDLNRILGPCLMSLGGAIFADEEDFY